MSDSNKHSKSTGAVLSRYLIKIPLIILLGILILISLILFTPFGRTISTNQAINFVSNNTNIHIDASNVSSPSIGEWKADIINVQIDKQPLINSTNFHFDWSFFQIFAGKVIIPTIHADTLEVFLPQPSEAEKEPEPVDEGYFLDSLDQQIESTLKDITARIIPIQLRDLSVDQLTLNGPMLKQPIQTKLIAQATIGGQQLLTSNIRFENLNGLLPKETPVAINFFNLETTLSYKRVLKFNVTTAGEHETLGAINGDITLALESQTTPYTILLQDSEVNAGDYKVQTNGVGFLQLAPLSFNLEKLKISAPEILGQILFDGTINPESLAINLNYQDLTIQKFYKPADIKVAGEGRVFGPWDKLQLNSSHTIKGKVAQQQAAGIINLNLKDNVINFDTEKEIQFADVNISTKGNFDLTEQIVGLDGQLTNLNLDLIRSFDIKIPEEVDANVKTIDFAANGPVDNVSANLKVNALGSAWGIPIDELTAQLEYANNELTIQQTEINSTNITVNASGGVNLDQKTLDITVPFNGIDMLSLQNAPAELPPQLDTRLKGKIHLYGAFDKPQADINLQGPVKYETAVIETDCSVSANAEELTMDECNIVDIVSLDDTIAVDDREQWVSAWQEASNNKSNTASTNKSSQSKSAQNTAAPLPVINLKSKVQFKPLKAEITPTFNLLPLDSIVDLVPQLAVQRDALQLTGKLNGQAFVRIKDDFKNIETATVNVGLYGEAYGNSLFGGLRAQGQYTPNKQVVTIESLGINYGDDSHLTMSGSVNKNSIESDLALSVQSTDIDNLPFGAAKTISEWPSELDIKLTTDGDINSPTIKGDINFTAELEETDSKSENQSTPFLLESHFEQSETTPMFLNAKLSKNKQTQSQLEVKTSGIGFNAKSFADIKLSSKGNLNLDGLEKLINPVFHQFGGQLDWTAQWQNGADFDGELELTNAYYEHLGIGTTLKDAQVKLDFNTSGLKILQAEASDGAKGRYTITGGFDWPWNDNKNSKLTAQLRNVEVVNRPDIDAQASGDIIFSSQSDNPNKPTYFVQGDIDLYPLAIQLDRSSGDNLTALDVEFINRQFEPPPTQAKTDKPAEPADSKASSKKDDKPSNDALVGLDIGVLVKQQAYLRGKGIDTELEGEISIKGNQLDPIISGEFRTLRGTAEILTKRFKIEEGRVRISDGQPLMNIKAVHERGGQKFIASVTGGLQNLNVSLSSDPPMPEDETLSRLLFGKSLADITAVQALQIASAVRSLTSQSNGLDPLAKTRNLLGVDQISLDSVKSEDGQENYTVGVGKYVSERVYVEIERSSDPVEPWQGRIEIELSPNVSLETSAQSQSGLSGVDLQWKRDY